MQQNIENIITFQSGTGKIIIYPGKYITYTLFPDSQMPDINDLQKELDFLLTHLNGEKLPFFADNRHLQVIDSQVTEFMKTKSALFASKCAILVAPGISKFLFHIALFFNKPPYPIKAFTDENKAWEWLMKKESDK